jgi:quinol monooxygenase YgiN
MGIPMTIIIAGWIDLDVEDVTDVIASAKAHIEGAYTENGCVHYIWTKDVFVPGRIHVYEEWVDTADLQYHFDNHWYKDMGGHLRKFPRKGSQIRKFRVDHIEPVYDPSGTPRADFFTAP